MQHVYLDNAATTKPDGDLLNKTLQIYNELYYNPSALYTGAGKVKKAIDGVRQSILAQFSANFDCIFTSSGTEADNTAVFSFAKRGNVVTTAGEHSAIYNTLTYLKQKGIEPRFAKLEKDGSVNVESLIELIDEKTTLVSVVHVNNETGAINDVNKIAKLVKQKNKNVIFHSDGVQAFLKIPYKISNDIDLYSISAHKICALKGTGALIYKKNLHITPMIFGGGQEKSLRSGTENTFGIFAIGEAVNRYGNVGENFERISMLNRQLRDSLKDEVTIISAENASPYVLSISLPGIKAEIMQRLLDDAGVIVGTGSACSSKLGTSRIITNCGLDKKVGEGVLRISFSYNSTLEDIKICVDALKKCAQRMQVTLR